MISIQTFFWIMLILFGVIGMMRGWTKEVVATAGLVLSIFAQLWFGHLLVGLFGSQTSGTEEAVRSQFIVRSVAHILFAFFAYQGPTLARTVSGGRFGDKARGGLQEASLGFIVGVINGYLIVGTIWSFLEFNIIDKAVVPFPAGSPYPFPLDIITRPVAGSAAFEMISKLPLPLLEGWLPLLVVALFLFVIIAMI